MTQKYKVFNKDKLIIVNKDWDQFSSQYKVIEAAGGVVFNKNNDLLMIYRNEKWDLPKGKININENISSAAIREVVEECGEAELKIVSFIQKTYHIYKFQNVDVLKKTYWFKMFCKNIIKKPQIEEGITKVSWIKNEEIKIYLKNSYPNIKYLIKSIK